MSRQDTNSAQEIEAVVERVSQLLHRQIGLRPEPGLRGRLRGCVRDDALRLGQDFDTYLDTLTVGGAALQSLLNKVTVQETAFFRHPEHFELLAREILPTLGTPITLWSAACANGQEAFSLAMLLEEHDLDGHVVATDLSTEALHRTSTAQYSTRELGGLSLDRIGRHLTRDGDDGASWLVNRNLRDRVSTFHHNLLDPIPSQVRACQVIFCRNVLIYFSPDHARTFLDRVADAMPAATLFLGAAETIWQLSSRFETIRSGDTFSYRHRADITRAETRAEALSPRPVTGSRSHPGVIPSRNRPAPASQPAGSRTAQPMTGSVTNLVNDTRTSARPVTVPSTRSPNRENDTEPAEKLRRAGERASAAGDVLAAVVAFRKCAYLSPHDPMAHLHLGLALESAGDPRSARRAYAAARQALTQTDPAHIDQAIEGYTMADLIRLLDAKQQVATP